MKEKEKIIATALVVIILFLWSGALLHVSPRFAGSLAGGVLGVSGALLMLVPLVYYIIKRVKSLKSAVTKRVPVRTLLAWHIYAGLVGPLLVLIHTGHKFESLLGLLLTLLTLTVVLSGFVGRYLLGRVGQGLREKRAQLETLNQTYRAMANTLAADPEQLAMVRPFASFRRRLTTAFLNPEDSGNRSRFVEPLNVVRHVEAIADVENSIFMHDSFKKWFSRWLKWHLIISFLLYLLLFFHIWASLHFGLRWFS
ncbi:MAG: hypothetical protein L3J63_13065 [Geopsychrobacter sp.]|nr:hypothetical protein [Geopsychrobacter sp.]